MKAGKLSAYEFEIEAAFVSANVACRLKQQVYACNEYKARRCIGSGSSFQLTIAKFPQAYLPIVGSGDRASVLHYNTNLEPLENNWLLVDAGGNYMGCVMYMCLMAQNPDRALTPFTLQPFVQLWHRHYADVAFKWKVFAIAKDGV
jgi:hypothetical protein